MKNKAIVLIAVRLNTKRLKKKALLNLYDKPLISSLTDRLKQSKLVSKIVWCTSKEQVDDKLETLAKKTKVRIFRGPSKDVMLRFILAAQKYKAKTVVRVTGDNPLTDPEIIDFLIKKGLNIIYETSSINLNYIITQFIVLSTYIYSSFLQHFFSIISTLIRLFYNSLSSC